MQLADPKPQQELCAGRSPPPGGGTEGFRECHALAYGTIRHVGVCSMSRSWSYLAQIDSSCGSLGTAVNAALPVMGTLSRKLPSAAVHLLHSREARAHVKYDHQAREADAWCGTHCALGMATRTGSAAASSSSTAVGRSMPNWSLRFQVSREGALELARGYGTWKGSGGGHSRIYHSSTIRAPSTMHLPLKPAAVPT